MKKKIFKTLVICMAVIMMTAATGCKKEKPAKPERVPVKTQTVAWDDSEFKKLLPKPEFEEIIILGEYDDWFGFESVTVTKEQCEQYIEACRAMGFTREAVYCKDAWYWADNAEGYHLEITYGKTWFELRIDNMGIE